jgi:predicted nucleotide-binding protein (sugar kinase/HSP70/actin superfamily)
MKKIKLLIIVLAIISLNRVSTLSAERADDFINSLTSKSRATLNNKGEHFKNLGEIERKFYNLCMTLDKSNIKEPSVLIIGGAYGARAAGALLRTEKVRVFF